MFDSYIADITCEELYIEDMTDLWEEVEEDYELADIDDDCGFDPYEGCFTYDC